MIHLVFDNDVIFLIYKRAQFFSFHKFLSFFVCFLPYKVLDRLLKRSSLFPSKAHPDRLCVGVNATNIHSPSRFGRRSECLTAKKEASIFEIEGEKKKNSDRIHNFLRRTLESFPLVISFTILTFVDKMDTDWGTNEWKN